MATSGHALELNTLEWTTLGLSLAIEVVTLSWMAVNYLGSISKKNAHIADGLKMVIQADAEVYPSITTKFLDHKSSIKASNAAANFEFQLLFLPQSVDFEYYWLSSIAIMADFVIMTVEIDC